MWIHQLMYPEENCTVSMEVLSLFAILTWYSLSFFLLGDFYEQGFIRGQFMLKMCENTVAHLAL